MQKMLFDAKLSNAIKRAQGLWSCEKTGMVNILANMQLTEHHFEIFIIHHVTAK